MMTLAELIPMIVQHANEYAREGYEDLNGDGTLQKCKVFEVTPNVIIQFCQDNNLPIPDEFLNSEIEV